MTNSINTIPTIFILIKILFYFLFLRAVFIVLFRRGRYYKFINRAISRAALIVQKGVPLRWTQSDFQSAIAALTETGSVSAAAQKMGKTPAALKDAFRRADMDSPSKYIDYKKSTPMSINDTKEWQDPEEIEAVSPIANIGKKTKTFVICSDVHIPSQSNPCIKAVAELLRDIRPDGLILNGDILDLIELSSHARGSVAQLEGLRICKVFGEANSVLDLWQDAAGPQCKENHFVEGNHEDRLNRWIRTGDNSVWLGDESVSIPNRLKLVQRGFVYHAGYPKAYVRLGHLIVTHGKYCTKYAAATHLERYRCSVLVGHVHTPGMHYGSGFEQVQVGIVTGHLADVNKPALSYASVPNSWQQGFAIVVVEPNGNFHIELKNFVDGVFYYGGKRYGKK